MNVIGTKNLNDERVQRVVRDLNAYAAHWSTLNPFHAKSLFVNVKWNGREYVGKLQHVDGFTGSPCTVHVAFSGK